MSLTGQDDAKEKLLPQLLERVVRPSHADDAYGRTLEVQGIAATTPAASRRISSEKRPRPLAKWVVAQRLLDASEEPLSTRTIHEQGSFSRADFVAVDVAQFVGFANLDELVLDGGGIALFIDVLWQPTAVEINEDGRLGRLPNRAKAASTVDRVSVTAFEPSEVRLRPSP